MSEWYGRLPIPSSMLRDDSPVGVCAGCSPVGKDPAMSDEPDYCGRCDGPTLPWCGHGRPKDKWQEDGTGTEQVDGAPTTCDSSFNRGYDAGYCAGMKAGAPPYRMPRWDQDKTARMLGLVTDDQCGNCGEEIPAVRRASAVSGE